MCMTCLGAHELTDVRPAPLSRRQVLLGGLVLGLAIPTPLSSASPVESSLESLESLESLKKTGLLTTTPKIRAREEWAGSKKRYAPKRRMCHEREGAGHRPQLPGRPIRAHLGGPRRQSGKAGDPLRQLRQPGVRPDRVLDRRPQLRQAHARPAPPWFP